MPTRPRVPLPPAGPVLVTGFEPFDGSASNPSGDIARALDGRIIAGRRAIGVVLPCVFAAAPRELRSLLSRHRPGVVLALGLAGGRTGITPERVAINVDDARIADNAGAVRTDARVLAGGPAAYWSTLPLKAIVTGLESKGVPASVSTTAGTFVCNHVFYVLQHALRRRPGVRSGFIHVPYASESASAGSSALPLDTQVEAIARAVEITLEA